MFGPSTNPVLWAEHNWVVGNGNSATGFSQGSNGTLLLQTTDGGNHLGRSTDGGKTWAQVGPIFGNAGTRNQLGSNGAGIWIAGQIVYYSQDDGLTWAEALPASYIGGPADPTSAFVFFLAGTWIAISASSASIYYTATPLKFPWTKSAFLMAGGALDAISDGSVIATISAPQGSATPSILTTADGIAVQVYPIASAKAHGRLAAAAGRYVAASNNSQTMLIGSSWAACAAAADTPVPFNDASTQVLSVGVDAEGRIYAVSDYGTVLFSVDGGAHWVADAVPWTHTSVLPQYIDDIRYTGGAMVLCAHSTWTATRELAC